MKFAAVVLGLLSLSASALAAPTVLVGLLNRQEASHCLDELLKVNSGENAKPYNFSMLVAVASPIDTVVSVLKGKTAITLFAPTDEAFKIFIESVNGSLSPALESLIPEILSYHVSNGTIDLANLTDVSGIETLLGNGSLSNIDPQILLATKTPSPPLLLTYGLGNAGVIDTISCSNGVIYVVNSVLYPPNPTSQTAILSNLTSLAEALNATDLIDTIDSLEALTVFAPSNEAFEAIANVTANLTTEQLSSILTYHAIPARVMSFDLSANQSVETVNGASLAIRVENGTVYVGTDRAKVITANVLTANGVVHIIDKVLLPAANETATNGTGTETQSSATQSGAAATGSQTAAIETQTASSAGQTASSAGQTAATESQSTAIGTQMSALTVSQSSMTVSQSSMTSTQISSATERA